MMEENIFIKCGERILDMSVFHSRVLKVASGYQSLAVRPGDAVALFLRNDFCFFEASYAASAIGAYAVPINWHCTHSELCYLLEDARPQVLVAHSDLINRVPEAIQFAVRYKIHILIVRTPIELQQSYRIPETDCVPQGRFSSWDDWLQQFDELSSLHNEVIQSMFYTSGTTAAPKGVRRLPQPRAGAEILGAVRDRIFGLKPGIRALVPGPLYHSAPNSFSMRALRQASRLILMPRFEAEAFLGLVQEHQITNAFMVPTMLVRLLKLRHSVRQRYDISSLQYVMIAAAPCPIEVKAAMIKWWGPIIHEFYGSTELGYMTACNSSEALAKPGTVGRVVDGATVKALDAEGHEVVTGKTGELYGRLKSFPDFTYNNKPEARAEVDRDGLVTCGDVGYFDHDGYLFLCDRARDMVISGGVNIYPAEIEAVLVSMPGVSDCAVFGIPDEEFGEQLMAVIQPTAGNPINEAEVSAYLRERISGYKIPRKFDFCVDLPREDSGKIFKRRLRDPYWLDERRKI